MINKKRLSKKMAAMILAGTMMFGMSTTAFAQASPPADGQAETTTEAVTPETAETPAATEETAETPQEGEADTGAAFSVPGNAEVQDDVTDGSSKEFLTIRTENNKTFYVIIDRATNQQNVYMLSNIDENDLQEFLDESSTGISGGTSVVLDEQATTTPAVTETPTLTDTAEENEEPNSNSNKGALVTIFVIALIGLAGYYYFKIYKPKKEEEDYEDENMELSDGLKTINEDDDEEKEANETNE